MTLSEAAEAIFVGVNIARLSPGTGTVSVNVIHVRDIDAGMIAPVSELDAASINPSAVTRQKLLPGDVLVSARGTLLKCAVVRETHSGCIASANFIIVRLPRHPLIEPELICAFLRQPETERIILSRVSGTAQPAMTIKDISSLEFALPSREKQKHLSDIINTADNIYRESIEISELIRDEALEIVGNYMRENSER